MGARLSETELQKSLDFCVKLFNPTTPEEHERLVLSGQVAKELLDASGPVVDPCVFKLLRVGDVDEEGGDSSGESDSESELDSNHSSDSDCEKVRETRRVLDKINARRVVHAEYAIHNLELEPLEEDHVVRLERGKLGLVRLEVPSSS